MARSFKQVERPGGSGFSKQRTAIARPKANLFSVYHLIAHRRIRYARAFSVLIACSVFLSVTVSFVITTIISKNVEVLAAKALLSKMPFHGVVVFSDMDSLNSFEKKSRFPGDMKQTHHAIVESNIGKLALLGADKSLPEDTIELLFPFEFLSDELGLEIFGWSEDNPSVEVKWSNVILPELNDSDPALLGWALVNPKSLDKLQNLRPALFLEFAEGYKFDSMNPGASPNISRFLTDIENRVPPGARAITPYTGTVSLTAAAKGAFSSWQFISIIVLLSSAAAITCILTVSFLGRKRSLGIFRVLGGTIADLRTTMSFEAAYVGLPGTLLGIFAGHNLAKMLEIGTTLPVSAYLIAVATGALTLIAGVWMPVQLIKNANCDQLLNNRPVYVITNPSCADCGLCGGI